MINKIYNENCLETMKRMPDNYIKTCITSPPYWGLRDYGVDGQLGLEKTPEEYVKKMVDMFREVRRVLKKDGTLWLNLGDTYAGNKNGNTETNKNPNVTTNSFYKKLTYGYKQKDIVGIPWMVAFALRSDGWYLRQDIIWCLSGGTWVYARTQKGEMPIQVRDLYRLKKDTVRLWNGKEWTPVIGMSKSKRTGQEIEIVLRSGERISCTKTHKFPSSRGLVEAGVLQKGDRLFSCKLPEATHPRDSLQIGNDAAWLAGLYLAEGSRSEDTIQIAGHTEEEQRWERIQWIAKEYGGSATRTLSGNKMDIRIYGKILNGIIDQFVSGKNAHNKCFSPAVWKYSNNFIESMMRGYLAGDGHWDEKNNRWRLGFCRNYNLERDLRTACARLGYRIVLNISESYCNRKKYPSFRGEIRTTYSSYRTQKDPNEIVEIRNARCREVYDIGVLGEPHEYALASGVLTHNSKPNPMPESVTDRCTKSHEYIFLLSKSERYFYDHEAIMEKSITKDNSIRDRDHTRLNNTPGRTKMGGLIKNDYDYRNKRSVWVVNTKPFSEAHFAVFPEELIEPCVLAGSSKGDIIYDPFMGAGTTAKVALRAGRSFIGSELNSEYCNIANKRIKPYMDQVDMFYHAKGVAI